MTQRTNPLTAADLIEILSEYPGETPIFDGRAHDMHRDAIREQKYDIWTDGPKDAEGYETPLVGIGLAIGRRV